MTDNTFRKRSGTTDRGKDYEDWVTANLVLQLVTNKNVDNFKISSNDAEFGAFDDIVMETESQNQKQLYAIQLKHGNKDVKYLSLNSLKAESGSFAIKKYFKSFKHINTTTPRKTPCKFILFTNLKLDAEVKTTIQLSNDDISIKIIEKIENPNLGGLVANGLCYTFKLANTNLSSSNLLEYERFFDNFLLYTNQPSVEETKNSAMETFQGLFSCTKTDSERYLQFISQWSLQEGVKEKLDTNFIKQVIALILLTPFIKPISFECPNNKEKLLRDAIEDFDITMFQEEAYERVKKMWGDTKTEGTDVNEKEITRLCKKYQLINFKDNIKNLDNDGFTKLLWIMSKCPLIVTEHQTSYKAMALCKNKKFILLTSGAIKEDLPKCSTFRTLSDMDPKSESYNKILTTFTCSLQGREQVPLKFLINQNQEFQSYVKTDDLVKMLDRPYRIGEKQEAIPKPYINRLVTVNLINIKYFERIEKNTVIILSCMNKIDKIKSRLGNFNWISIEIFLRDNKRNKNMCRLGEHHRPLYHTSPNLNNFVSGPDLYIREAECFSSDFEKICLKNPGAEKFHHFKIVDETTLEWVRSKGDISDLEPYRKENQFVEETTLYTKKPQNNITLVNGDPGMGKSELLKNIKNNSSVKAWTVFLQSTDITLLCTRLEEKETNERENEFMEFIIDTKYNGYPDFDKKVIEMYLEKHQVAYFWDALDEITTKNIEIITELILELSKRSSFQWITSRCHLKKQLEKQFDVLSRNISQFNEKEQTRYIQKRLEDLYSDEDINEVIEKIRTTVTMVKHNEVLGVPLQIFMLTELFRQDHDKYFDLLKKIFSLTDLYQHIIDQKFNRYYKEKADVRSPNDALRQVLESHKRSMFEKYEKAGVKALVQKELFKHLNINCDDFLNEIEGRADSIGLITEVTDNFPQFLHNSYAEFFVAKYFTEHHKEIDNFQKILFDGRYANIRFFFDLLTAKDSSAHIAVLYKNIDLLKQHKDNLNTCEDKEGRNLLQLACSWGQRYPILSVQKDNEYYIIDNEQDNSVIEETSEYNEMLQYLLENCDASESDDLFNVSSVAYAEKADCLLAKLKILLKQDNDLFKFKHDDEGISILYYSAKFGLVEVTNLFEKVPFVKVKKDNSSLLHLAVTHGQEEYLKKLLSLDVYKTSIDHKDKYGKTALYKACQSGYYKMAELLIESGADLNSSTKDGCTPLHTACLHTHDKIVELLLKSGANINIVKKFGITPLHEACWNGHEIVVDLLLKSGANINAAAADGCTSLYVASRNKHDKVVKLLVTSGADINFAQNDGVTPLFIACQEGHERNVEVLVKSGAEVNLVTNSSESPLFIACQNGHKKIVEMLIKSGADVNIAVDNGWTPLHITCQQKHLFLVQLLIEFGADPNHADSDGVTPSNVAESHGQDDIVRFLKDLV